MIFEPNRYVHRHVYHNPTYCHLSYRDIDGELPRYKRHILPRFAIREAVQSKHSMNKFKNAISWMLLFADKKTIYTKVAYIDRKNVPRHIFSFRLGFITLTLPSTQIHPDKYIKDHLLQPFLRYLQRYFVASYVWKAESQLNGNIHFHITIDTFVPWRKIQTKWNRICKNHGYCEVNSSGQNNMGDASTQIKAIRNENDLSKTVGGYLTKGSIEEKNRRALKTKKLSLQEIIERFPYISCNIKTKQHYSRFIEGRIWGCSENLSKIRIFTDETVNSERFQETEHKFFHDNNVQNLATVLLREANTKHKKKSNAERRVLGVDEESLKQKFEPFNYVFIHRHLKFCKLPDYLAQLIAVEKSKRKFQSQKNFTVESLL